MKEFITAIKRQTYKTHGGYFLNTTLKVPRVGFSVVQNSALFDFKGFCLLLS